MIIGPFTLPDSLRGTGLMDTETHTHTHIVGSFEGCTLVDKVMLYRRTHAEYTMGHENTL